MHTVERRYWGLILDKVEEQLSFEPGVETTNRSPLRGRTIFGDKAWHIRFGPDHRFRVFYEFNDETRMVWVHAIGVKLGNRLYIGGQETIL
jgi:hypothetical protein